MLSRIRSLIQTPRQRFHRLCTANGLTLDYTLNKAGLPILSSIFQQREYADHFPFYESAKILDIGGHYGYFSLFAQQHTANDAQIVTLEPHPNNQRILTANLQANAAQQVRLIPGAIGAQTGQQQLFLGASSNHSILPESQQSTNDQSIQVDVFSLPNLLNDLGWSRVDFLKLDCEGAEYDILLNLPSATYQQIQVISMEFHDLKRVDCTGKTLLHKLQTEGFTITTFQYSPSNQNLNYGRLVGVRG